MIGVILQASREFALPGVALLLLALASVLLVFCVQFGFWARHHFFKPEEAVGWWEDYASNEHRQRMLRDEQRRLYKEYKKWAKRGRRSYSYGIIALLSGTCVALIPPQGALQWQLRFAAAGVLGVAVAVELVWLLLAKKIKAR